jgi:hypothetical protein
MLLGLVRNGTVRAFDAATAPCARDRRLLEATHFREPAEGSNDSEIEHCSEGLNAEMAKPGDTFNTALAENRFDIVGVDVSVRVGNGVAVTIGVSVGSGE